MPLCVCAAGSGGFGSFSFMGSHAPPPAAGRFLSNLDEYALARKGRTGPLQNFCVPEMHARPERTLSEARTATIAPPRCLTAGAARGHPGSQGPWRTAYCGPARIAARWWSRDCSSSAHRPLPRFACWPAGLFIGSGSIPAPGWRVVISKLALERGLSCLSGHLFRRRAGRIVRGACQPWRAGKPGRRFIRRSTRLLSRSWPRSPPRWPRRWRISKDIDELRLQVASTERTP
jgi:hypothetical protein